MKKIIASIVAMLATISMMACGNQTEVNKNEGEITTTAATTTTSITTTDTINTTMLTTTTEVSTQITESQTEVTVMNDDPEPIVKSERHEEMVAEPVTETEPIVTERYIVYKPSTHYLHFSDCRWNSGDAYRVDCTTDLVARLCNECNPDVSDYIEYVEPEPEVPSSDGMTFVGTFEGTYYTAWDGACGGSGRYLIDCSWGSEVKGSIASRTLYNMYGYYLDGRTTVYLESASYPQLSGYYYVDDSTASWVTGVIDFYYTSGWNCPFQNAGRIYDVKVYI